MKLVFATRNRGKLAELRRLVEPLAVELLSLDEVAVPEVIEDAPTFAGNAEKKARAAHAATGLAVLADDSGLEVDALDGAPGVRSARYAADSSPGPSFDSGVPVDEANNLTLLRALKGTTRRTARFRCVLAFVDEAGALTLADGACEGRIAAAARGSGGFGYDPLFLVGEGERTLAELAPAEKNQISHRGAAMRLLLPTLERWSVA